jgi:hypothetical protein
MLSDEFVSDDGYVYTDGCYHGGREYKGDHSECIRRQPTFCLGCTKEIQPPDKPIRAQWQWEGRTPMGNTIYIRVIYHEGCAEKTKQALRNAVSGIIT